MAIHVGDAVELRSSRVSRTGGADTPMSGGLVGRVCKVTPFGYCRVQFPNIGCRLVHGDSLTRTTKSAPRCTAACSN